MTNPPADNDPRPAGGGRSDDDPADPADLAHPADPADPAHPADPADLEEKWSPGQPKLHKISAEAGDEAEARADPPSTADQPQADQPQADQPPAGAWPPPSSNPPPTSSPPPSGSPPPEPNWSAPNWSAPNWSGPNWSDLVRPNQGRYLAGVCAAIGRATNTDPVLWRVLLAVLVIFGGVGLLAYLIGWLLIPSEGDTTSPVEGLFGRAGSTTPVPLVIVLALAAVLTFAFVVRNGLQPAVVGVVVILGVLALLTRNGRVRRPSAPPPWGSTGYMPPAPGAPAATGPTATGPAATGPGATGPAVTEPGAGSAGAGQPAAGQPTVAMPATAATPTATSVLPPTLAPPVTPVSSPTGYRPPFAPHGPYAGTPAPATASPYAASLGYTTYPAGTGYPAGTPYPGLGAPTTKPPKPPRPRSKLGRIALFVALIGLGLLATLDVGGQRVRGTAYIALVVAVIGAGLLVGAWFGRARWLIPIGAILSLFLGFGTLVEDWNNAQRVNSISERPVSVDEIEPEYRIDFGEINLDLSDVDFATSGPVRLSVQVAKGGTVRVILPENVDAEVEARVEMGDAAVLDRRWGGMEDRSRTITDDGADGPGGGKIFLDIDVGFGELRVTR